MDESTQKTSSYHSSADYMKFRVPEKQPRFSKLKRALVRLGIILVLIGLVGLIIFVVTQKRAVAPTPKTATSKQQARPQTQAKPSVKTEHYDSPAYGLGIDYPETWEVVETSNANRFVIHSDAVKLKLPSGQQQTGQIVLTVNPAGQNLTMFDTGNGLAVRDSKKLSYRRPSPEQRGETYITFVQYPATTVVNGLDAVYVSGDFGYIRDQAVPKEDLAKANPLISIAFLSCTNERCTGATTPTAIDAAMWDDADFSGTIETILRSITVN